MPESQLQVTLSARMYAVQSCHTGKERKASTKQFFAAVMGQRCEPTNREQDAKGCVLVIVVQAFGAYERTEEDQTAL